MIITFLLFSAGRDKVIITFLLFSAGRDKVIITWDLMTRKQLRTIPVYEVHYFPYVICILMLDVVDILCYNIRC